MNARIAIGIRTLALLTVLGGAPESRASDDRGTTAAVREPQSIHMAQAQQSSAAASGPVLLQCNLDDSMDKEEYILKTQRLITKAVNASVMAGYDGAKVYADQVAVRDSKLPQMFPPITLVLALDEPQNKISNRQGVSSGPVFSSTDVHWRETDNTGTRDYLVNRVTGGIVITNVLPNGNLGYWLLKGACAVTTQRAF